MAGRISRLLPTPSMTVSLLALVIALGGAGYAATGGTFLLLGSSNVASATTRLTARVNGNVLVLKNNKKTGGAPLSLIAPPGKPGFTTNSAVKIPNLNGDYLDGLDSTAFVQTDTNAFVRPDTTAFVRAPIGGWHYIGDPGEPAFAAGWQNVDTAPNHLDAVKQQAAFRIDNNHFVHITGDVFGGAGGNLVFTLPAAYCPKFDKVFIVPNTMLPASPALTVSHTCAVSVVAAATDTAVFAEDVRFPDAASDSLVAAGP